MLKYSQFSEIKLSARKEFEDIFAVINPEISDFSFTDIFAWRNIFNTKFAGHNGNLLLIMKSLDGLEQFMVCPIGRDNIAETFAECVDFLKAEFGYAKICSITSNIRETLKNNFDSDMFMPDRDLFDYIYRVKDLADLKGAGYAGKRNFVKRFINNYKYTRESISGSNIADCREFLERWCRLKNCGGASIKGEVEAVGEMLSNFSALGLTGILLRIAGRVEAFSLGGRLNSNTAQIYAEKANPEFTGIYQAINQIFAQELSAEYEFVNREQDLGNPGLRKAKESYHPYKMAEKYIFIDKRR